MMYSTEKPDLYMKLFFLIAVSDPNRCFRTSQALCYHRAKPIFIFDCRFIFPLLFAVFNLAYWLYYLLAKGSNDEFKDRA